jgi:hypothetical protein
VVPDPRDDEAARLEHGARFLAAASRAIDLSLC